MIQPLHGHPGQNPSPGHRDALLSLLRYVGSRFGRQAWEGAFGMTELITFLAAEGWAVSKLQGTYRSMFRTQVFRPCPRGSGWVGVGVEPQLAQLALVPPWCQEILCLWAACPSRVQAMILT